MTDISDGVVGDLSTFRGDLPAYLPAYLSIKTTHPTSSSLEHLFSFSIPCVHSIMLKFSENMLLTIFLCSVDASKAGEGQLEISINDGDVPNAVQVFAKCRSVGSLFSNTLHSHQRCWAVASAW